MSSSVQIQTRPGPARQCRQLQPVSTRDAKSAGGRPGSRRLGGIRRLVRLRAPVVMQAGITGPALACVAQTSVSGMADAVLLLCSLGVARRTQGWFREETASWRYASELRARH